MRTWLLARVLETLEARGARPALIGGMALAGVIRISKGGEASVDVVVGKRPWQTGILDRRQNLRLGDLAVPVVEAADLVLLKLDAGGPQDQLDIRLLLRGPGGAALRAEVERRLTASPESLRRAWLDLDG